VDSSLYGDFRLFHASRRTLLLRGNAFAVRQCYGSYTEGSFAGGELSISDGALERPSGPARSTISCIPRPVHPAVTLANPRPTTGDARLSGASAPSRGAGPAARSPSEDLPARPSLRSPSFVLSEPYRRIFSGAAACCKVPEVALPYRANRVDPAASLDKAPPFLEAAPGSRARPKC
jgi:hypothetical protein